MHDWSPDSDSCHSLSAARQRATLCPYFFILCKGQSDLVTQGFSSSEGECFTCRQTDVCMSWLLPTSIVFCLFLFLAETNHILCVCTALEYLHLCGPVQVLRILAVWCLLRFQFLVLGLIRLDYVRFRLGFGM